MIFYGDDFWNLSIENIYVGTCGWSYDDWKQVFYPNALKQQNYLEFYSNIFRTVEIDSSFYHTPFFNESYWREVAEEFVSEYK